MELIKSSAGFKNAEYCTFIANKPQMFNVGLLPRKKDISNRMVFEEIMAQYHIATQIWHNEIFVVSVVSLIQI